MRSLNASFGRFLSILMAASIGDERLSTNQYRYIEALLGASTFPRKNLSYSLIDCGFISSRSQYLHPVRLYPEIRNISAPYRSVTHLAALPCENDIS